MNNECENYCEQMEFPKTFEEFLDGYSFIDSEEVYTNKCELIQTVRVEQGYEHFEQEIRADERNKIINQCNRLLNCGMGKKKSLEYLIKFLEKEGADNGH